MDDEQQRREQQKWPDVLWIVRHGESAGNVARVAAYKAGLPLIDIATRDVDVPLSPLGEQQAQATGRRFGLMAPEERPTVVLTSPYLRACETARLICDVAGIATERLVDKKIVVDERLREKEFGIIDRLTRIGIQQNHPEQAELRKLLGKFYHRPPGGESWCDVILRLRSVIDTITREYCRERVLVVCHSVVVSCFMYLLERMTEDQILALDRDNEVANCSITRYECDLGQGKAGKLVRRDYNAVDHLKEVGTEVTAEPDAKAVAP